MAAFLSINSKPDIGMTEAENFSLETQIKVIGIGHGGSHAVKHMMRECGVQGVELIYAHTGTQALPSNRAHRTVELGREATATAMQNIRAAITGTDLLFIAAGMDDSVDIEAVIAIARTAKDMGVLTIGLIGAPGGNTDTALAELQTHVDSLIVTPIGHLHGIAKTAVSEIAAILNEHGHVNVDFQDVRTVMREPGRALVGTAQASGPERARLAAAQAVAGIKLSDAKAMLVLVTAAKGSLKLFESRQAMSVITANSLPSAHVIYGAAYDDALGDSLRVTVVATGLAG